MRVAALYDIHGNLPALEAVLAELAAEQVDEILIGGDVAAGAMPHETLARLREDGELAPAEVLAFVRGRLDAEEIAFLLDLPERVRLDVDGLGPTLFCHATPRNDVEVLTAISPDERWRETLAGLAERVVVCGHTHMQFDRVVDGIRVVNAGSVGMPYEDEPGAYWALLGPEIELRRTP